MSNCIFCKIIKGEIPCFKIYEDANVLAFLDIKPVNPGHVLVIPKEHYENFLHIDSRHLQPLVATVQKVGKALVQAMGCEGFNLGLNNGVVAGQVVPHVHFHIMPRRAGDGYDLWHGREYEAGQAQEVADKIREAL